MIGRFLTGFLAALLLAGCMQGERDFFAASEKVVVIEAGTWTRISGRAGTRTEENRIGNPVVVTKTGAKTYSATGRGTAALSFVPLEGTSHYIVIVDRTDGPTFYYLTRRVGADVLLMDMGCPANKVTGLTKTEHVCEVTSRAAVLAAAYEYLSDPRNLGPSAPGALYRKTAE